jgi:phosphatidylserine decarboxylase
MRLAPDGLREVLVGTATLGAGGGVCVWAAMAVSGWWWIPAAILLVLWLFVLAFFRDPDRVIPTEPGLLVAPADGKVTEVSRLDSYEGIDGPVLKISIFLSVFDVHINRAACDGRVVRTTYKPGEFLDVRHPECGLRNEWNTIVLDVGGSIGGLVVIRQIAGLIARRIVCNVSQGATVRRGERIGMIKFGSRTDLVVPAASGLMPAVQVNDVVRAGSSILLRPAEASA